MRAAVFLSGFLWCGCLTLPSSAPPPINPSLDDAGVKAEVLKLVPSGTPVEDALLTMERLGFACQVLHVQELIDRGYKSILHDPNWARASANGESLVSCNAAKPRSFWREGLVSLTHEEWSVTLFYKEGRVTDVDARTYGVGP